jgi:hypothetical protein
LGRDPIEDHTTLTGDARAKPITTTQARIESDALRHRQLPLRADPGHSAAPMRSLPANLPKTRIT